MLLKSASDLNFCRRDEGEVILNLTSTRHVKLQRRKLQMSLVVGKVFCLNLQLVYHTFDPVFCGI